MKDTTKIICIISIYGYLLIMFVLFCVVFVNVKNDINNTYVTLPPNLPSYCKEHKTYIDCRIVGVKKDYYQTIQHNKWMPMSVTWLEENNK